MWSCRNLDIAPTVISPAGARSPSIDLQAALLLHQAARYADAARAYQALLECDPDDPAVLHLFGVMHQQCGHSARAAELITRAIALRPDAAAYHANLAEAQRSLRQFEQAAANCRTALALEPEYPEALNNLGLVLHEMGRHEEAIAEYEAALSLKPDFAVAQNNRGTTLRAMGKTTGAVQAYRAAIALDPTLGQAHANLGQLLADQGQLLDGLAQCRAALHHQPELAAGHNNLGNVLRALDRWDEAEAAFAEAIRLEPNLAIAYCNLGLVQQRLGKWAAALRNIRRAAELTPDDPETLRQLADAQGLTDDWPAAVSTGQKRVELQPEDANAFNDLGWAYQSDGRPIEANVAYRRALELEPTHLNARLNLGSLQEELGAMAEAEAYYREAERQHPHSPLPLCRRATLARGRLPDADRDKLRFELFRPYGPGPRMNLLFGLAHVADAGGDYAEAAACLETANALARNLRRDCGQIYDADEHTRYVDRLITGFTPEVLRPLTGSGDSSTQPVFVFGLPRSGTTLVEQILASHSLVFGAGELALGRKSMDNLPAVVNQPEEMTACLAALDADSLAKLARGYQDGVAALLARGTPRPVAPARVVDKMPDNYLYSSA